MDVMKPELLWIEGRCYRVNPIVYKSNDSEAYVEEEYHADYGDCDLEEPCDEFEIETLEDGRFKSAFHVARTFFPYVIGVKGTTRKRLETETKTQVRVPKPGQDGDIVVTGSDQRSVCAARRRINLIVMSSRQKLSFTHFLSIPMNGKSIKDGFLRFKDDVLSNCKSRGLDPSIFQLPEKLHLTLATMVLSDDEERKNAVKMLEKCKEAVIVPILEDKVLKLNMKGIEYMNDDPREVDVLYGKVMVVGEETLLQDLADNVVEYFVNYGDIMEKQYEHVKLHVTLMNTLFREERGGVSEHEISRKKRKPRESFDASLILSDYSDFDFGEEEVNSVHLSLRYSTAENGYYQSTFTLDLY